MTSSDRSSDRPVGWPAPRTGPPAWGSLPPARAQADSEISPPPVDDESVVEEERDEVEEFAERDPYAPLSSDRLQRRPEPREQPPDQIMPAPPPPGPRPEGRRR